MRSKLTLSLLVGMLALASAAEPAAEEYHVKGAFLLNFTNFVEWPAQSFKGPADSIAICIFGSSPFTPELDLAARKIMAENRSVVVKQVADIQQLHACQIVFISASERKRVHAVMDALQGGTVLTVGESDGFIASGGVIEFKVEESRVRMEINEAAAKRAGLQISSRLLSLAQAGKK